MVYYKFKSKVSLYQSAKDSTSSQTEELDEIFYHIKHETYKDQVLNLRNQPTPEAYKPKSVIRDSVNTIF